MLNDGSGVTVEADDHVVVVDSEGRVESESWCGSNGSSYTKAVGFLTALQRSLRRGDRGAVAELVLYPLRWNGSRHVSIDDRATLLDRYAEIFTPAVLERIASVDARGLFCNSYGFMIGNGLVWGSVGNDGRYGLTTLNA
jgi:hypothetical protein